MASAQTEQPNPASPLGQGGFEPYLQAVRKHPFLFVIVTLATVLGAVGWLTTRSTLYRATAEVLVTPVPYDDLSYLGLSVLRDSPSAPVQVFDTAAAMIDSPGASQRTGRLMGRGWSAAAVEAAVTVEPLGESQIVAVQATDDSPQLAVRLVDTFTRSSLRLVQQTLAQQARSVLDDGKTYPPEELAGLQAVRHGIDPFLSLLYDATAGAQVGRDSAPRLLGLSLIPGIVLGTAASLLSEAFAARRRRRQGFTPPGDVELSADRDLSAW